MVQAQVKIPKLKKKKDFKKRVTFKCSRARKKGKLKPFCHTAQKNKNKKNIKFIKTMVKNPTVNEACKQKT